MFGEKVGRLHVEKQDLDKIQTRKVKALKKRKRGDDDANDEGNFTSFESSVSSIIIELHRDHFEQLNHNY